MIPNAADDPFGAMNAMAAVGTVQRAPEIVIVNDGRPVESIGKKSAFATFAMIGLPAIFALVIGILLGKVLLAKDTSSTNKDEAKELLGDKTKPQSVAGLKQTLSAIDTLLDETKTKSSFRPDKKFDTELKALAVKLDVKEKAVLTRARSFNDDLAGHTLQFYAGVAEVKALIDTHIKAATADDNALSKAAGKMSEGALKDTENAPLAASGQLRYAVLIQAPSDSDKGVEFGARIVELGGVYCGNSDKPVAKCPEGEQPSAVAYRSEVGAPILTKGDIASPTTDAVPVKKIVQMLPGGVRDNLIKGAEGVASEVYYQKRLRNMYELLRGKPGQDGKASGGLIDTGNDLERKMTQEINR